MSKDNVILYLMQQALNRAHPSGLPSNLVVQQFGAPYDTITLHDAVLSTVVPTGYPYGWGDRLTINPSSGTWTQTLAEPEAVAWLLKLSAYVPSGGSLSLSATVGAGTSQTLTPISPAQVAWYSDRAFSWADAMLLGTVGITPWGTPTNWPDKNAVWLGLDATAVSGDPPGQWLLRKWLYVFATQTYTISLAADNTATAYMDGVSIVTSSSYATMSQGNVPLAPGLHLLTIEAVNYGTSSNPTGVLLSAADPNGNILEDGANGAWQTSGSINQAWSYSSGAPLLRDTWYVIDQPNSTSVTLTLAITGAQVNDLLVTSLAPWRWDAGGQYDATANTTLPVSASRTEVVS